MSFKRLALILAVGALLITPLIGAALAQGGNPFGSSAAPAPGKGQNLGPAVNSAHSDLGPVISPDGQFLFFTSDRPGGQGGQDVWVSRWEKGTWGQASNLGPPINTPANEGPDCFSISDQALYFTACDRETDSMGGCDIYVSFQLNKDAWSKPVNLGAPVNTKYNEQNASVSPDGDFIIFSSDRPGGIGGSDLWIAKRGGKMGTLMPGFATEGRWLEPENMGPHINTPDWEGVGFLMPDKNTLYFSSRGRGGLGLADIFRSTRENGEWTEARNMGDIINTPRDDLYFTLPGSGDLAYFSSNSQGGLGGEDIYSIPIPLLMPASRLVVIRGAVKDAESGKPVKALVKVVDPATAREVAQVETSPETGKYEVVVKLDRVQLQVESEGRRAYSETFEVEPGGAMSFVSKEILLQTK